MTDETGEPVIGANIHVEGTNEHTVTDIDGKFTVNAAPGSNILVSFIGYSTQRANIGDKTNIDVTMSMSNAELEEVVVVGYGTQKKVNLSGAVETVNSKQLENRGTNNAAIALQGLVPNLQITPSSGRANSTSTLNVRGTTSINGGDPLILVDGVTTSMDDFQRLNTQDIDNISVIKDASAAAIYGARASFGVILVTLKHGEGRLQVNVNNNFNIKEYTRRPEYELDPYTCAWYREEMGHPWYYYIGDEGMEYAKKLSEDSSLPRVIPDPKNPSKWLYLSPHSWFDDVFNKTALSHQHNVSISGSSDKVSYFLSGEYYGEDGYLKYNNDGLTRWNARSNVEYRVLPSLSLGNNTSFTHQKYHMPFNYGDSMLWSLLSWNPPLTPVYNPDGTYTDVGANTIGKLDEGGSWYEKSTSIYTKFNINAEIIKNMWSVKGEFAATIKNWHNDGATDSRNIYWTDGPDQPLRQLGTENYAQKDAGSSTSTMFQIYTDLHKDFGKHSLSAVAGFSQEYEHYNHFSVQRPDIISSDYPSINLASGTDITLSENDWTRVLRGAFYRVNYIFDGKYIVETNGRYDGSSAFRKGHRYGFFPSFSAAWVFSNEKIMQNLRQILSFGKLRASYGSLGNQNVGPYATLSTMSSGTMSSTLLNGISPMGVWAPGISSEKLTWEKVYTINGGIDLYFFNNRLAASFDIYRRNTKDMLTKEHTLPGVFGTGEPQINGADLATRGWELSVNWRDQVTLAGRPFVYSARFVLSDSKSWITKYDNPTKYLSDYFVGKEFGVIYGYVTDGFFTSEEDIKNHADQTPVTSYPGDHPIEPGDLKFRDLNGDGVINSGAWTADDMGDCKVIGNTTPRYQFGLDLNFNYTNFDLRLFAQGVGKRDFYPTAACGGQFYGPYLTVNSPVYKHNLDCWSPDNPNGYFPRPKSYTAGIGGTDLAAPQTRYLQNAAYLRMKNITLGYTLPKSILSKIKMRQARIYFSGDNLFEITNLSKAFDPEGLSNGFLPLSRTYSFGINIGF